MYLLSNIAIPKNTSVKRTVILHALWTDPFGSLLHDEKRQPNIPPDVLGALSSSITVIVFYLIMKSRWLIVMIRVECRGSM